MACLETWTCTIRWTFPDRGVLLCIRSATMSTLWGHSQHMWAHHGPVLDAWPHCGYKPWAHNGPIEVANHEHTMGPHPAHVGWPCPPFGCIAWANYGIIATACGLSMAPLWVHTMSTFWGHCSMAPLWHCIWKLYQHWISAWHEHIACGRCYCASLPYCSQVKVKQKGKEFWVVPFPPMPQDAKVVGQ